MTEPQFSICIPNFNHGKYIGETIESVLRQTYGGFEIVVVDNASTDDSVSVVESFRSEKIRLFRNPYNVGFAPNLDRAASRARNEFIIVLSSDDLMMAEALATYASIFRDWGARAAETLLGSAYEMIDGDGRVHGYRDRVSHFTVGEADPAPVALGCSAAGVFDGKKVFADVFPRMLVPGAFCSNAYARELYTAVGGYSSVNLIGPDAHFAYKCLLRGAWVTFVDRPLFRYRIHTSGQVGQARREGVLKIPVDRYVFTFAYSDEELADGGVRRAQIITHMVDEACLRQAARHVRVGERMEGLRHILFAAATYPRAAFRRPQFWGLMILLALGPVGTIIMRGFGWIYDRRTQTGKGRAS